MTSKHTIELFAEKIPGSDGAQGRADGADFLVGEVSYSKGGMSYFTGNHHKRGYSLRVVQTSRGVSPTGFSWESFVIGGSLGRVKFLEETKAFSAKKLAALAADPAVRAKAEEFKAYTLAKYIEKKAEKGAVA